MRSPTILRSSIVLGLFAGVIAACSASATDVPVDDDSGAAADTDSGDFVQDSSTSDSTTSDMDSSMTTDAGHDSAVTDSAIIDAPFDGIVVAPDASLDPPGSPCPTNNLIQRDLHCGICGYRDRVCLSLTDGGAKTWQPWGACQAEVVGGCVPGSAVTWSCGFCGHQTKTCQNDCSYTATSCTGTGMCAPGTVEFAATVSCDAGTGRTRTCDGVCVWGDYSASCSPPPPPATTLTVSGTVGNVATQRFSMPTKQPRLVSGFTSSPCPITLDTTSTSFVWVQVKNPTAQIANVSVWSSLQVGGVGTVTDTMMTAYPGTASPPSTVAQRDACMGIASDDCDDNTTDPTACTSGGAGLMKASTANGDKSVNIPANGYIWVYVTAYSSSVGVADIQVNTKTHSLM